MTTLTHRIVRVGDIEMHVAEQGEGTPIVLCHGFPGLWFSWRHQLEALSAAGYRAIAPDMRGLRLHRRTRRDRRVRQAAHRRRPDRTARRSGTGRRGVRRARFRRPPPPWDLPSWAPDRSAGADPVQRPRMPRLPIRPSDAFAHMAQRHFVHFHYFQQPGVADGELGARPSEFLAKIFHALSGAGDYLSCWDHPSAGNGYLDVLPDPPRPAPWPWLSDAEFEYYAAEFARTGFTGGLNWYAPKTWCGSKTIDLHDRPITVPTLFVAGERDRCSP